MGDYMTDDPRAGDFASLTRVLLSATTVGGVLQHVVDAAKVVIANADLVSVTLRVPHGAFYTPVETSPEATDLDQVQYRTGEGPCLDAARPDGPAYVVSDDLRVELRWRQFAKIAAGHGYRSILSTELVPAPGAGRLAGALNIYSRRLQGLTKADRYTALLLATHASLALAHVQTAELADLCQTNLRQAIESRDVIGQAKGILMNRQGVTADQAFELLRRTSQDLNVKLVDVARTLTDRHSELDPS